MGIQGLPYSSMINERPNVTTVTSMKTHGFKAYYSHMIADLGIHTLVTCTQY